MIHVQQILTEWSDGESSDGLAESREAIADAYRVPYFNPEMEGVWHQCRLRQSEQYHCTEFVNELTINGTLRVGSFLLTPHPGLLLVDFVWSEETTGLPKRESKRGFRLRPKEWGRAICNGWRPDPKREGGRCFHRLVLNILFNEALTAKRFLVTEPVVTFDESTDL